MLAGRQARFMVASGNTFVSLCQTTSLSVDRSTDSFDGTTFFNNTRISVPTLPNLSGSMGALFTDNANVASSSLDAVFTAVEAGMTTPVSAKILLRTASNTGFAGGLYLSGSLSAELNGPVSGTINFTAANNITFGTV